MEPLRDQGQHNILMRLKNTIIVKVVVDIKPPKIKLSPDLKGTLIVLFYPPLILNNLDF